MRKMKADGRPPGSAKANSICLRKPLLKKGGRKKRGTGPNVRRGRDHRPKGCKGKNTSTRCQEFFPGVGGGKACRKNNRKRLSRLSPFPLIKGIYLGKQKSKKKVGAEKVKREERGNGNMTIPLKKVLYLVP